MEPDGDSGTNRWKLVGCSVSSNPLCPNIFPSKLYGSLICTPRNLEFKITLVVI